MLITFSEEVADYRLRTYSGSVVPEIGRPVCELEAWTTHWRQLLGTGPKKTVRVFAQNGGTPVVYYVQNNGRENVLVYGSVPLEAGVATTLPRLTLGYYLILAGAVFVVLVLARLLLRRYTRAKLWIERAMLLPAAYFIGHVLIMGWSSVTYSFSENFAAIALIAAMAFAAMLIAHCMLRGGGNGVDL